MEKRVEDMELDQLVKAVCDYFDKPEKVLAENGRFITIEKLRTVVSKVEQENDCQKLFNKLN